MEHLLFKFFTGIYFLILSSAAEPLNYIGVTNEDLLTSINDKFDQMGTIMSGFEQKIGMINTNMETLDDRVDASSQLIRNITKELAIAKAKCENVENGIQSVQSENSSDELMNNLTAVKFKVDILELGVKLFQRETTEEFKILKENLVRKLQNVDVINNPTSAPCPSPFKLRGEECFYVHDDKSEALNWDESRQRCLDMGGDLAQPEDALDFIEHIKANHPNAKSTIWLGATDREVEQEWKWVSGAPVPHTMFWGGHGNQPSGDGNCMEIHYFTKSGFFQNDWYCHKKGLFACEFDRTPPPVLECPKGYFKPQGSNQRYIGCPDGFFMLPSPSNQCLKFFNGSTLSWDDANTKCLEEELVMARPYDALTVRQYITEKYGAVGVATRAWLGARGNGKHIIWQRGGEQISPNNPLWWPNHPGTPSTNSCMQLLSDDYHRKTHPGKPYAVHTPCTDSSSHNALCELVME